MKLTNFFANKRQSSEEKKAALEINRVTEAVIAGQLNARIDTTGLTDTGQLPHCNAINQMLDAIVAQSNAALLNEIRLKEDVLTEASRAMSIVKQTALPLMTCDKERRITSMNPAVLDLLNRYKSQLQRKFPGFNPDRLIGECIDLFHKDPEMQKHIFAEPGRMPHKANIQVLDMYFNLTVFPVWDQQNNITGYAVEWLDRTAESNAITEIQRVTGAAIAGQLDERLNTTEFTGVIQQFGNSVNTMLDAILLPIGEGNRILAQISNGKIDELIAQTYQGDHEKMKLAVNNVGDHHSGFAKRTATPDRGVQGRPALRPRQARTVQGRVCRDR